ncbi:MAG TPA: hypothetical protein VIN08_14950 [Ohtaekwangia sp.]|uniref:hypothetical protein n=1 Tax=Ohtaekwangia sp. TaxID=2066019 RepID=UPI002F926D3B
MIHRIIDRSYVGEVLQHLYSYSNELHIEITLLAKGGYFYRIDENEKRTPLQGTTIEEAVTYLANRIALDHPHSNFSFWWRENFSSNF